MEKDLALHIKSRFLAGFSKLNEELSVAPIALFQNNVLLIEYYLPSGRLSYKLDFAVNIEESTQNILGYTCHWQPAIVLTECLINGVNPMDVSAQILSLDYYAEPFSPGYKALRESIQENIQVMTGATKKSQVAEFERFAAKFCHLFNCGSSKEVAAIRKKILAEQEISEQFSLVSGSQVLVYDAYKRLMAKMEPKKRKLRTVKESQAEGA